MPRTACLAVVLLALLSAACAGVEEGPQREEGEAAAPTITTAPDETTTETTASTPSGASRIVACPVRSFEVDFVQAESVTVTREGGDLAVASYEERSVSETCADASKPRSYPPIGNAAIVYGDVRLACEAPAEVEIDVHPITDGDNDDAVIGSNLIVYTRSGDTAQALVSAVLKNRELAEIASRIYHDQRLCRVTPTQRPALDWWGRW